MSWSSRQYCRDVPVLDNTGAIVDLTNTTTTTTTNSFNLKKI